MKLSIFHKLEEGLIGLLLVTITLLVFVEVILRFGFNTGLHWSQEVTLLLNAWFVLIGASWGLREKAHISVDAFVKILPHKLRVVFTCLAITLSLVYVGLLIYGSWVYLSKMRMIGIEMQDVAIEKWIVMSVLLIGFGLMGIRLIGMFWRVLRHGEVSQFHKSELPELMNSDLNNNKGL